MEHRVVLLTALERSAQGLSLQRLRAHLAEQDWIAPTRLNLLREGGRAGELPRMLLQVGRLQTAAAGQQIQRLLTLIEPLVFLANAGVIGAPSWSGWGWQ